MIHRLRDLRDPNEPLHGEVEAPVHHANDRGELPEVIALRRDQWICFEERDDHVAEITPPIHLIGHQVLAVIVMPPVPVDPSASEKALNRLQRSDASLSLNHREDGLQLPSQRHLSIALDGTAEAAFTVDEADDPLLESWPFLLIFRTRRIVTGHEPTIQRGSDMLGTAGCSDVPAFSQLHSRRHRREGQRGLACDQCHLRTVRLVLRVATRSDHLFTLLRDSSRVWRMASEDAAPGGASLSC
jgi:hypothetical protein